MKNIITQIIKENAKNVNILVNEKKINDEDILEFF